MPIGAPLYGSKRLGDGAALATVYTGGPRHQRKPTARRTHCPAGHLYDATNTYRDPAGCWQCRACRAARARLERAARRAPAPKRCVDEPPVRPLRTYRSQRQVAKPRPVSIRPDIRERFRAIVARVEGVTA